MRAVCIFGISTCVLTLVCRGQVRETLDAAQKASETIGGMTVSGLLTMICLALIAALCWTVYKRDEAIMMLATSLASIKQDIETIKSNLEQRPCVFDSDGRRIPARR